MVQIEQQDRQFVVSVITVVYNNVKYIEESIESVLSQNYPFIEYVVIDGRSTDGTVEVIEKYRDNISVFLSEPDKGIYDALNKGIQLAVGDVIAILHSDDLFYDQFVVSDMVNRMTDTGAEFCFSDLIIVDQSRGKVLRYYMAYYYRRWMFRIGWLPPHPTCFIKKSLFDEFDLYSTNYEVAADFDFLVRIFYGREINWVYLNRITVKMRYGGASNSGWKSKIRNMREISQVLHDNNIFSLTVFQILRYFIRLGEMIIKPKYNKNN
jgi:glycosyltransferase involved in cell wall biosynthesis